MRLSKLISTVALLMLLLVTAAAQDKHQNSQPNGGSAPSGAVPLMVIESLTHDFGEVKPGTALRYAFKVKNQGKADLLITNVSPG